MHIIASIVVISFFLYILIRPLIAGTVYFPTHPRKAMWIVDAMVQKRCRRIVDLGSGDGRFLVYAAARGIVADGYEINPLLVLVTTWRLRRRPKSHVRWQDLWRAPIHKYDGIVVYGYPHLMRRFSFFIQSHAKPGTHVWVVAYPLPQMHPDAFHDGVYYYRTPLQNEDIIAQQDPVSE